MIQVSHRTLYAISGAIWLAIGMMLLNLGLGFLMHGFHDKIFVEDGYSPLFTGIASLTGGFDNAAIVLVVFALIIGFLKGRLVLQKAALKTQNRISKLSNPTLLTNIYTPANFIIIGCMMGLGMLMKYLALPFDIRGMIDTAVGCALMQGAVTYFQMMSTQAKGSLRNNF